MKSIFLPRNSLSLSLSLSILSWKLGNHSVLCSRNRETKYTRYVQVQKEVWKGMIGSERYATSRDVSDWQTNHRRVVYAGAVVFIVHPWVTWELFPSKSSWTVHCKISVLPLPTRRFQRSRAHTVAIRELCIPERKSLRLEALRRGKAAAKAPFTHADGRTLFRPIRLKFLAEASYTLRFALTLPRLSLTKGACKLASMLRVPPPRYSKREARVG